jgi:hypothetical protein
MNAPINNNDDYKCQHGGPGELETADKQVFVVTVQTNFDKIHKALLFKATHQELLAAELVVMEELLLLTTTTTTKHNNAALQKCVVDQSLTRLYFSMASKELVRGRVEEARILARIAVYLAMYLRYGDQLWEMTNNQPARMQQITLNDMYTALGQIGTDQGLAKVLNAQTPCDCLEKTFPSLKRIS